MQVQVNKVDLSHSQLSVYHIQRAWKGQQFTCDKNVKPDFTDFDNHSFQKVHNQDMYVLSAWYDTRLKEKVIRVLGLAPPPEINTHNKSAQFFCTVSYEEDSKVTYNIPGRVEVYWEFIIPFCYWKAAMVTCKNPKPNLIPKSVSVVSSPCEQPTNFLKIPLRKPLDKAGYAICANTIRHYTSKDIGPLLEFFELNILIGVTKVLVYDFQNVTNDVKNLVQHYMDRTYVDLIPWKLPVPPLFIDDLPKDAAKDKLPGTEMYNNVPYCVANYAQRLNFMDCLYSAMGKFEFMTFVDKDEFIVPRDTYNVPEYLRTLPWRSLGVEVAGYVSSESHFCTDPQKDEHGLINTVWTSRRLGHENQLWGKRPKTIVKPELVIAIEEHLPREVLPGHTYDFLNMNQTRVHHYRNPHQCYEYPTAEDKRLWKIRPKLLRNIYNTYEALKHSQS